jgi:hypothetical protein
LRQIERIRENPTKVSAIVTGKNCGNHGFREYAFKVDGIVYRGGGQSYVSGDECNRTDRGAPMPVYFETGNPTNNMGSDPAEWLFYEIIPIAFFGLSLPALKIVAYRRFKRRKNRLMAKSVKLEVRGAE